MLLHLELSEGNTARAGSRYYYILYIIYYDYVIYHYYIIILLVGVMVCTY